MYLPFSQYLNYYLCKIVTKYRSLKICNNISLYNYLIYNSKQIRGKKMQYISESAIIQKISQKICEPKQTSYSQQAVFLALSYLDNHEYVDSTVYNKYNQRLKVSLFFDRTSQHQNCLVYMHGYGSNRLEALYLMKYLPKNISLCCFDFSAEGKSDGKIITYGQKQKDDIKAVLGYLRSCRYKKFILWGRSMGATCTLLFTLKHKPIDVILQILDSPFISFTQAALQLTKKQIVVPEIILKLALEALKTNLSNKLYNPFQIDLNKPIYCQTPTIFIYSQRDQVLNPQNSKNLINNFKGCYFEKIIIKQLHNAPRKQETIKDIVNRMKKYLNVKNHVITKKENFSVLPQNQNFIKSKKLITKRNSFDSYGIWVSSKQIKDDNNLSKQFSENKSENIRYLSANKKCSIKLYSKDCKIQKSCDLSDPDFQKGETPSTRPSSVGQKRLITKKFSSQLYL